MSIAPTCTSALLAWTPRCAPASPTDAPQVASFPLPASPDRFSHEAAPSSTAAGTAPIDSATAAHVGMSGPVPDFSPLAGIAVHAYLRDACPALWRTLHERLGDRVQADSTGVTPRGASNPSLAWMRDYHPLFTRQPDGRLHVVRFLSVDPDRDRYSGEKSVPVKPPAPEMHAYPIPGQTPPRWLSAHSTPLIHQNGNLVSSGNHVFVTSHLLEENAVARDDARLAREGYRPRSADEVLDIFAAAVGVRRDRVVVLPRMPGEGTGHVDMFVMALGPDRVLIPEIHDEAIDVIGASHEQALGRQVQAFLDDRAAQLAQRGIEVERLPMMAPINLTPASSATSTDDVTRVNAMTYSPTNSLLADVPGRTPIRTVFTPTFDARGFPPAYVALKERYEAAWQAFFTREGWTPVAVDASSLSHAYGVFRCLSHPLPAD